MMYLIGNFHNIDCKDIAQLHFTYNKYYTKLSDALYFIFLPLLHPSACVLFVNEI